MRFFPSRKTLGTVALVLISGAALLAFSFLSNAWQREANHERAFASLSLVSEQLESYLDGVRTVLLQSLVNSIQPEDYIRMRLPGYAPRTLSVSTTRAPDRGGYLRLRRASTPQGTLWYADYLAMPDAVGSQPPPQPKVRATFGLHFDDEVQRVIREFGSDQFTAILLATTTGEIITQTSASVVRVGTLRSLTLEGERSAQPDDAKSLTTPRGPHNFVLLSQYSNVVALRIAGALYNLYIQPVQLSFSFGEQPSTQLVICGLARPDQRAGNAIPIRYSTLVFAAVVLISGVSLLWPLLKLSLMRADERLRRSDVLLLALALLTIAVLLPTGMLAYAQMTERLQEQGTRLARVALLFKTHVWDESGGHQRYDYATGASTADTRGRCDRRRPASTAQWSEVSVFRFALLDQRTRQSERERFQRNRIRRLLRIFGKHLFTSTSNTSWENVGSGSSRVIMEPVMGGFAGAFAVAIGLRYPSPNSRRFLTSPRHGDASAFTCQAGIASRRIVHRG